MNQAAESTLLMKWIDEWVAFLWMNGGLWAPAPLPPSHFIPEAFPSFISVQLPILFNCPGEEKQPLN